MTNEGIKYILANTISPAREIVAFWSEEDKRKGLEFLASKRDTVEQAIDYLNQLEDATSSLEYFSEKADRLENELAQLRNSKRVELAAQFMAAYLSGEPFGTNEKMVAAAFKAADAFLEEARKMRKKRQKKDPLANLKPKAKPLPAEPKPKPDALGPKLMTADRWARIQACAGQTGWGMLFECVQVIRRLKAKQNLMEV